MELIATHWTQTPLRSCSELWIKQFIDNKPLLLTAETERCFGLCRITCSLCKFCKQPICSGLKLRGLWSKPPIGKFTCSTTANRTQHTGPNIFHSRRTKLLHKDPVYLHAWSIDMNRHPLPRRTRHTALNTKGRLTSQRKLVAICLLTRSSPNPAWRCAREKRF